MKPTQQDLKSQKKKAPNKLNVAARYSGIAFEMIFVMLAGVFGGLKLDEKFNTTPVFTAILALLSVFTAMYIAIKDFLRKK